MELYNYGERTENAQLRLNCSNLNHHLFLLHVLDDPRCPCGHDIENVHHFFFQCPLYVHNRHDLFENVQQICNVTLNSYHAKSVYIRAYVTLPSGLSPYIYGRVCCQSYLESA